MLTKFDLLQLFSQGAAPAGEGSAEAGGNTQGPAQPQEAQADPAAEFEDLIRGKYKQQYEDRLRATLHKRLKGSRETVERYNALTPALSLLAQYYGVDPNDAASLSRAVEADDSFYAREAQRRGMEVRDFRTVRALEQENAALRQSREQGLMLRHADRQYAQWERQAVEARNRFPDFDMNREARNPMFRNLLHAGVDVATAYAALHSEDLMAANARELEQKLVNKFLASSRPGENGTGSASTAVTRTDVASMTRSEREAIRKRAAKGERIRF